MKKSCFALLLTIAFGCVAQADVIDIAFDSASLSGSPGDTLQFFGTLTNTSADTVFLNGDSINLSGFTVNDLFFSTVPISLDPGGSSGDIELFDVMIPSGAPGGDFPGSYTLLGGGPSDATIVGSADFNVHANGVSAVPEPSLGVFLVLGLGACAVIRRKVTLHG